MSGGLWAAKTNYSYCTTKEDPIDPPDLEISIIVYFAGRRILLMFKYLLKFVYFIFVTILRILYCVQ